MTDAANRTMGGTSVPPTFKGKKWYKKNKKNIDLYDALSVRKKANFFKRDRLFIITCANTTPKKE